MAIQTKIERYCDKFINNNYDKRDREKDISIRFEWFVNSMHSWHYSSQSYNAKPHIGREISLGTAQGGDAFFILVNNQLFSMRENIDTIIEAIKKSNEVKVIFHLIQIKKSNKAKLGDFKKFVDIPLKIFTNAGIAENQSILVELKNFIQSIVTNDDLKNITHEFELFFYTEKNENDIESLRKEWNTEIDFIRNAYAEYTDIKIHIRGSDFINNTYEQFISNDLKLFVNKQNLKSINNNEYLIGFLTAEELLNCIAPTQGNTNNRVLYPDVFKNNIRLYLGATPINANIEKTLQEEPEKFHLYNNGLTITTKRIDAGNVNHFQITPVNIVNGCQTANSVYNVFKMKSERENAIKIPVKIIIAQDDEYEKITIRTNSQNGLSEQDLVSITNIQKELEELFQKTTIQGYTYFYKRQNSIDTVQIDFSDFVITINDILRANFSCLMLSPHKVLGYFDTTTSKYIDNIFEERFLKIYHILTILLKVVENELEENHKIHYRLRYHIAYLLYKICNREIQIDIIENYFRKKKTIDDLSNDEINQQEIIVNTVYNNVYSAIKDKITFAAIIKYIIETLNIEYSELVNIKNKDEEKILYKTVDSSQMGAKVFNDIYIKFAKSIDDFYLKEK
jgi:hypothetical protein